MNESDKHCSMNESDKHCSMNESDSMAEAFSQPLFLCSVCHQIICHFIMFLYFQGFATCLVSVTMTISSVL